jgi:hypothetical protein
MFDSIVEPIQPNQVTQYVLMRDGLTLTYSEVLALWQSDESFCRFFTRLLSDSPFAAYRWETPMLNSATLHQPFQFVLLNSPRFTSRATDDKSYADYFAGDGSEGGVISFANLSGDAVLVVPTPRTDVSAYGHLAAFLRLAPDKQKIAFWRVVGETVNSRLGKVPLWLSTAGGGVAWLHVRLDPRPKYYGYSPYKSVSFFS